LGVGFWRLLFWVVIGTPGSMLLAGFGTASRSSTSSSQERRADHELTIRLPQPAHAPAQPKNRRVNWGEVGLAVHARIGHLARRADLRPPLQMQPVPRHGRVERMTSLRRRQIKASPFWQVWDVLMLTALIHGGSGVRTIIDFAHGRSRLLPGTPRIVLGAKPSSLGVLRHPDAHHFPSPARWRPAPNLPKLLLSHTPPSEVRFELSRQGGTKPAATSPLHSTDAWALMAARM
jgi:hypothetical protein